MAIVRPIIDNEAIHTGYASGERFCVNDGEGYSLAVVSIPAKLNDNLAVPYTKDYAKEKRKDAVYPYTLFKESPK